MGTMPCSPLGAPTALQVVLSHTPYRELAKELGDKPVVISGRGALDVAKAYGFTRAVTTAQLSAAYPTAVPFCHNPGLPAAAAQDRLRHGIKALHT